MKYISKFEKFNPLSKKSKDPIIEYKKKGGKFYMSNPRGGKWVEISKVKYDRESKKNDIPISDFISKKNETFTTDDNRTDTQSFPKYNQAERLAAKNYVEDVFSKGGGAEVNAICKEIGSTSPQNDEELDALKEKAIEYYIKNPERIEVFGAEVRKYPYNGGDGIPRTNNIGGTFHESYKPGPDEPDAIKLNITPEEMRLFSSEASLMKLIKRNKITLLNNQVWYDKEDNGTKKILDIFFDKEDESRINESILKWNCLDQIAYDDTWLNNASTNDLNRLIFATNIKGETKLYLWNDLMLNGGSSNTEVLINFYKDSRERRGISMKTHNKTKCAIYDGSEYKEVLWKIEGALPW